MNVNECDLLEALTDDEEISSIFLMLERFSDPLRFLEQAGKTAAKKPLFVMRLGNTKGGAMTAALVNSSYGAQEAAFRAAARRKGFIPLNGLREFINYASIMNKEAYSINNKVAIVSNSPHAAVLFADTMEADGLEAARLSRDTIETCRQILPRTSVSNPVLIQYDAYTTRFESVLQKLNTDEAVGSIVIIATETPGIGFPEAAAAIQSAYGKVTGKKPIIIVFMGGAAARKALEELRNKDIPCFQYVEDAAGAIAGLHERERLNGVLNLENEKFEPTDINREIPAEIIKTAIDKGLFFLSSADGVSVVRGYGIPGPMTRLCANVGEVVRASRELRFPLAMKLVSPKIMHRGSFGGVELGIEDEFALRLSYNRIITRFLQMWPRTSISGMEVQQMIAERGREVSLGVCREPELGIFLVLQHVREKRASPDYCSLAGGVSLEEIMDFISRSAVISLLEGRNGMPSADLRALAEAGARLGILMQEQPSLEEILIDPLHVGDKGRGCLALDVKITLRREAS